MKKPDYLSWNDYFMAVAQLSAMRSKDPNTQVGACIVNSSKKIVGVGYNGFPTTKDGKDNDKEFPWDKGNKDPLDNKYLYVIHAETSAVLNSNQKDLTSCVLYVSLFPCADCAKIIAQSGINKVYYLEDKYHNESTCIAARKIFDVCDVEYIQHIPNKNIKLE